MVEYSLNEFAGIAGGRVVGDAGEEPVRRWLYDSRLPFQPRRCCFLALPGPSRSGFAFVPGLIERGLSLFCVSETDARGGLPAGATYLVVDDVLAALQRLAAHRLRAFGGRLVAITGSNGKTIVKEWLYALLGGGAHDNYRSPGSANSQLGVPLSALGIPASAKTAVIEVGVSRRGEMAPLARLLGEIDLGILTNLGSAHDAGFASREEKLVEKVALFRGATTIVYRADADYAPGVAAALASFGGPRPRSLTWTADTPEGDSLRVLTDEPGSEGTYPCTATDAASRENLAHAVVAARHLGVAPTDLRERLAALPHPDQRLRAFRGRDGCQVIDDTYSADREGLGAALDFFAQHRLAAGRSIAVVGPLRDLGMGASDTAGAIAEALSPLGFDLVVSVGDELRALGTRLPRDVAHHHAADVEELLDYVAELELSGASLLVKGPRDLQLERLTERLRVRAHDVRLEIDLDALTDNLAAFRRRLAAGTRICVMVKAQAYGSGSPELARFLADRGVDYLAVAYVDEGVELRRAGSRLPIIVANASGAQAPRLREYALEPEITSLEQLRTLGGGPRPLPCHLKIDTGMHRLGFAAEGAEFAELLAELRGGRYRVASVFSHLSASDDPRADGFTLRQNERLLAAADAIAEVLGSRPLVHLLNSAGAWRLPRLAHDMVRLGIGLYGLGPGPDPRAGGALTPVHRWVARIVRVRSVRAGEVVGYGLGGVADRDRRIGVVNVGYADGLRRAAGDGALALYVGGRPTPTVGSVCMDFCMVDLAAAPRARVGDEVEVFGHHQGVEALAACFGTIPYEVFTGIGQRVRRVYYR